jgi:predicted AAA+ superfamily ATPase
MHAQVHRYSQCHASQQNSLANICAHLSNLPPSPLLGAVSEHGCLYKHSTRPARRRAAPPKLITLSNAFLAVVDPRGIPDRQAEPSRFGAWVENACLAHAWNAGQHVSYWREEPFEVDRILEGSWGRWAIEVKTGAISPANLRGLAEFARRHRDYRPLVLCDGTQIPAVTRQGVDAMPWRDFLLRGRAAIMMGSESTNQPLG